MAWFGRDDEPRARGAREVQSAFREALACLLAHDLDGAEEALASIVRGDSDQIEAYLDLAELYRTRGEIGRAIRMHQNLLLRSDLGAPDRDRALRGLAADFRQGGFLQRAIAAYEELLDRRPKDVEVLRALARLQADARNHERAIALQRRLDKLEPDVRGGEAELLVEAAEAAQAEGRLDDARKLAKRAVRRGADQPRAHLLTGTLEAERGKLKQALAAWRRALDLDPRIGAEVYPRIESALSEAGREDDFKALLREMIEARPGDTTARLALVRFLAARGDAEEALGEATALIERDPDDLRARAARARAALAAGRDADALKALAALLEALDRQGHLSPTEALR